MRKCVFKGHMNSFNKWLIVFNYVVTFVIPINISYDFNVGPSFLCK